jgi:hypothetical protein
MDGDRDRYLYASEDFEVTEGELAGNFFLVRVHPGHWRIPLRQLCEEPIRS